MENMKQILLIFILAVLVGTYTLWEANKEWPSFVFLPIEKKADLPEDEFPQAEDENQPEEKTAELVNGLPAIKELDKDLILEKIEQGKEFLYRMEYPELHGFYKKYDAPTDSFEKQLHAVYSASIIYTFLYINDLKEDEEILEKIPQWAGFLLFMQNKNENDKDYGAFHYSYYYEEQRKEEKFVVGTAALSIFTLLRLYDLTGEEKYLESAKLAGDWLTTMQEEDGGMRSYTRYDGEKWVYNSKESLLYNGQCLSALSKLYNVVKDEDYLAAARKIADRYVEKYEQEQGYIQGEWREKNPISNSWAVMSLMDFYRVSPEEKYKKVIFELSSLVLQNQKNDPEDLAYYGGWEGAYSTSGTGWISEVMSETYRFCLKEKKEDCEKYKEAVIRAIRWIVQNTYSTENSSLLPNPDFAFGGVFWNSGNKYVRTDSVCHAVNGYVRIMDYLPEGSLLSFN